MKPRARITAGTVGTHERPTALTAAGIARIFLEVDARAAAAIGAALVILVGVPLAAALNIWIDEAFTLHTTGGGPIYAWRQAISFEAQPPVYFVLLAAWRTLNEASIAFARLPSVVFAGASVAVIVGMSHRVAPRVPPLVVALITALNPFVIWAAVEMRVYALVLFIGAVLTWLFFEAFLVSPASRRARIWYVAVALAGLYTQYYVGFVLVAQAVTLLIVRRDAVRAFAGSMAIVALGFAPFVRVAVVHVSTSGSFVSRVTPLQAVHEIANVVFAFVLPHDVKWSGFEKTGGFLIAAALVIALIWFGRPALRETASRGVALQWLGCLAVFSLLFGVSGVPLDPLRHLIVIAPSSLLVAYVCLSSMTQRRAFTLSLAVAVYAVFAIATLWTQYRPPLAKPGDWQRVAATLSAGDQSIPIAVFPAEMALPLSVYLPTATIAVPRPMPFTVDYVRATTLADEAEVARRLDPVLAKSPRLWLVTSGSCSSGVQNVYDYNCRYLETYLDRKYRVVRSVTFRGSLARLFTRASNISSVLFTKTHGV